MCSSSGILVEIRFFSQDVLCCVLLVEKIARGWLQEKLSPERFREACTLCFGPRVTPFEKLVR
jgi:hypothetical protein